MEKLLARWDRRVNCRSITPLFSLHSYRPLFHSHLFHSWQFSFHLHLFSFFFTLQFLPHLCPPTAYILNHFLCAVCIWFIPSVCVSLTPSLPFCVWNQWSNCWHCLWFMAHSSEPLSGAGKALCAAACVWMTMGNQSHYDPQPRPSHSGHCRLHLAPWFMDAILAPERDMKGSLKMWGYRLWYPHSAKHHFEGNLTEVCFKCIHAYV